jgi:hypothetical protein
MNWKIICEVGIKILAAAVAGTVVFVGINKTMAESGKVAQEKKEEPDIPSTQENNLPQVKYEEPVVLSSLRATQNGFCKLFAVVQSLTLVAENLTRIFGSSGSGGYYASQPYYSDPWSFRQPVNAGGQTWTRISPFIIEAGPSAPNSRSYYCPF